MNIIIQSTLKTLKKSQLLLDNLTDVDLCNASVSPYYSSIGSHIRHILDFYECIFSLDSKNTVDLTARSRNKSIESQCSCAKEYLTLIIDKLNTTKYNMYDKVSVVDDLGLGKIKIEYTLGALFSQANSHTIHHYAIINYILEGLNISFSESDFGYNPTTPKATTLN